VEDFENLEHRPGSPEILAMHRPGTWGRELQTRLVASSPLRPSPYATTDNNEYVHCTQYISHHGLIALGYNNYETSYNTSYGAGGGGGGGGWMPAEGGSQNSPSGGRRVRYACDVMSLSNSKVQDYSQDSLRPVTIKQIRDAQSDANDDFKIDGSKTSQVHKAFSMWNLQS
jgi:hypothetical protein